MPQLMRLECAEGHGWEVESVSLGVASDSDICAVCGAPSTSQADAETGSADRRAPGGPQLLLRRNRGVFELSGECHPR